VRLIGCLPRSNDAQGPGLQGGAIAESLQRQRLYESGLPLAGAKAGARAGVPSDASGLTDRVNGIVGTEPCIHAAVMGGMLLDRNAMAAEAGIMLPQRLHPAVQGGDRTCSPGGTVDHVAPASALSYPRS